MGTYIATSDLNNRYGSQNIIDWSNLDPDATTLDSTRVTASIAYAESYVENRFRGQAYTIPFSPIAGSLPPEITTWMADLAGVWLWESRAGRVAATEELANRMSETKKAVNDEMDLFLSGSRRLPLAKTRAPMPNCPTAH